MSSLLCFSYFLYSIIIQNIYFQKYTCKKATIHTTFDAANIFKKKQPCKFLTFHRKQEIQIEPRYCIRVPLKHAAKIQTFLVALSSTFANFRQLSDIYRYFPQLTKPQKKGCRQTAPASNFQLSFSNFQLTLYI